MKMDLHYLDDYLRKTRDLLLPKLMSGEVPVSLISVTDDKTN